MLLLSYLQTTCESVYPLMHSYRPVFQHLAQQTHKKLVSAYMLGNQYRT